MVASEPSCLLDAGDARLTVNNTAVAGSACLARFRFDGHSDGLATGLPWLGGSMTAEYWQIAGRVDTGFEQEVEWRCGNGLCFLSATVPDTGDQDMAELTERVYLRLLQAARNLGYAHLLRIWNYLRDINHGTGDAERYRQFCIGRGQALQKMGVAEDQLCAGSAIGSTEPLLRVYALTGIAPGRAIENPRQISAYHYPRNYGPHSPSFTRATALHGSAWGTTLLISGTASVVGHATAHTDSLADQLLETARNLEALLCASARSFAEPQLATFNAQSRLRAYVRHASDWPQVRSFIEQTWPGVPFAGLCGDICRTDLLMEVEAVHQV